MPAPPRSSRFPNSRAAACLAIWKIEFVFELHSWSLSPCRLRGAIASDFVILLVSMYVSEALEIAS